MKIELKDGTIIEITNKNIAKVSEEKEGFKPSKFTFYTPDKRKFSITEGNVTEYVNEYLFPLQTHKEPSDLTELLEGHEGETFWSPCWGECEFLEIHSRDGGRPSLKFKTKSGECRNVTPRGCLGYNYEGCGGECIIWPSKNHRTWADFGKDIWAVKKESGELDLYLSHPKYGKHFLTTVGYYYLLYGKKVGVPYRIA